MLFYMPGRNLQTPNLHINNIKLECLDSFNFLGITIDKHLTWKEQINLIANKISRTVGVKKSIKKLYTRECTTHYLQHSNNTTFELWDSS